VVQRKPAKGASWADWCAHWAQHTARCLSSQMAVGWKHTPISIVIIPGAWGHSRIAGAWAVVLLQGRRLRAVGCSTRTSASQRIGIGATNAVGSLAVSHVSAAGTRVWAKTLGASSGGKVFPGCSRTGCRVACAWGRCSKLLLATVLVCISFPGCGGDVICLVPGVCSNVPS
jgi:hypothetical protein